MTIYLVFFVNFQGGEDFAGAFSTDALAEDYISRFQEPRSSFRVIEYSLDSE